MIGKIESGLLAYQPIQAHTCTYSLQISLQCLSRLRDQFSPRLLASARGGWGVSADSRVSSASGREISKEGAVQQRGVGLFLWSLLLWGGGVWQIQECCSLSLRVDLPRSALGDEAARKSFCKEAPLRFALSSLSYRRVSTVDAVQPPVGPLGMESKKGLMWALCFLVAD